MSKKQTRNIKKIARIRDKATEKYLEVIEFPTSKSDVSRLELPPSVVNEPGALEKQLRDAGAILPKVDQDLQDLLSAVAKSDAPEEWVYEARTGWTKDGKAFVLVDRLIGDATNKIIGINRANSVNDPSGQLSNRGSWKSWRDTVADPARHSGTLMFAISVALAAPLLAIVNRQSFTINLFGRSRAGKSVATLVGASVIGLARTGDLMTWNITDARLEQRLAEFNDAVFPIDDLATMRGTDKEKYQRIRELAYKITGGWTTARHDSFTSAHEGAHHDWNCIVLTSSEKSVRDLAHAVKLERQHGEALRLIDVPAVIDGQDHIFDRLPNDVDKSNFDAWKRNAFAKMTDACEQNHGRPWRMYIKALIAEPKLKEYVERRISYFERRACDDFDGDVARDVARKFGLIYAGGMLGIRCGLLPWEKKELLNAVRKTYLNARQLLPDDGVSLRLGIAALRDKLRQLPQVSTPTDESDGKREYDKLDGYKQRLSNANRYVIKGESFKQIFSTAEQQALVTKWLIEKKRITLAIPKQSTGLSARNPKDQFIWPDGERRRSIEIIWPLKQKKTQKKGVARKAK